MFKFFWNQRLYLCLLIIFLSFIAVLILNCPVISEEVNLNEIRDLQTGLHLQAWMLYETDLSGKGEAATWQKTVARNCAWIAKKGYNVLLLDTMDPEGGAYFFTSPVLKRNDYLAKKDILKVIVKEAHGHSLTIYADITVLAWRMDKDNTAAYGIGGKPLGKRDIRSVIETLLTKYGFDGIVEESFPPDYIQAIYETTRKYKKKYIHKFDDAEGNADIFMTEDYVGFISSSERVKEIEKTGAEANNIGFFTALLGHAAAIGKPGWIKVCGYHDLPGGASRNVLLLRAVQFHSNGYFWMPDNEEDIESIRSLNIHYLSRQLNKLRIPLGKKPVVNAIIAFSTDNESDASFLFLNHAFGPISNGLMLSGYDLRTTFGRPLPDADAYVVFAIGLAGDEGHFESVEFPDKVLPVMDSDKPVIVVACGIGNTPNWKKVMAECGITTNGKLKYGTQKTDIVEFLGNNVPWGAFPIWEYTAVTMNINPEDVAGTVLVADNQRKIALVVKNQNRVLVNGNVLHLQTSFIFNSLLKKTLHKPFFGYGVVGKRSAFFAIEDTPLVVDLPFERGANLQATRFGNNGKINDRKSLKYLDSFSTYLERNELLVIEPPQHGVTMVENAERTMSRGAMDIPFKALQKTMHRSLNELTSRQILLQKVKSWMYQIQEINRDGSVARLAEENYDMLVIEPGNTVKGDETWNSQRMVKRLKKRRPDRLVIAYIDIGEAESYRTYWKKNWRPPGRKTLGRPDFIITEDPDGWAENYPVAFWDNRWYDIVIDGRNSLLKKAIADGYDGIYMDWVEAYNNEAVRKAAGKLGINPASAMVDFIIHLRNTAKKLDPEFLIIAQNAPYLINHDVRYAGAVDAIAFEDTWFRGTGDAQWNDPASGDIINDDKDEWSTESRVKQYKKILKLGIPVFTCDYCLEKNNARKVYRASSKAGFIPLVTRVSLSRITTTPPSLIK